MIKTAHTNILETGTVTLQLGAEDASAPLWRLCDRRAGRMFKITAAETLEVRVDQGANPLAADTLLIPSGHGLDGMTLSVEHSDDAATWTPVVTGWVQSGSDVIAKSWTSVAKRHWRFVVTSPQSIPQIGELFITSITEWARGPLRPHGPLEAQLPAISLESASGEVRSMVMGSPVARRVYEITGAGEAQKAAVSSLYEYSGTIRTFWLFDHEGKWLFGRLLSSPDLMEIEYQRYAYRVDFMEGV